VKGTFYNDLNLTYLHEQDDALDEGICSTKVAVKAKDGMGKHLLRSGVPCPAFSSARP
jgi:hypothetical protein